MFADAVAEPETLLDVRIATTKKHPLKLLNGEGHSVAEFVKEQVRGVDTPSITQGRV